MTYSTPNKRLNLIQVLRGVAAILVVLAHGDLIFNQNLNQDFLFKIFTFGGSGVDFFFVLSGFIIWYVHKSDIGHTSKVKTFFIKRFTRIYPIYWVVLTLKLSASYFLSYDPDSADRNIGEVIKAFLLFPQDRTILSSSFLGVSWTLSFEVFFYIIFGVLIGLKPKFSFPIITTWMLVTFAHFIGLFELPKESVLLQFIFSAYNIEFALGCLAAYLLSKYKIDYGMSLVCLGLFFYTLAAIDYYYELTNISNIISFGIPSTLLVLGSASLEMNKHINTPNILIYIGNASYSIYLMHGFAINNITKVVYKIYPSITENIVILNIFGLIACVLSIMFGCAVYSYIEKPLFSAMKPILVTT
jgi:peptidoglycan/LPS O-acetylase OafA/YrhL